MSDRNITCLVCDKSMYRNHFEKHLKSHDLTLKSYYHGYIIKDQSIPKCHNCDKELKFIKLSKPYGKFCSQECRSNHTITKLNSDPEFQRLAQCGQARRFENDPEFREKKLSIARLNLAKYNSLPWKDKLEVIRTQEVNRLSKFDKSKNLTERFLYLVMTPKYIKIGVNKMVDDGYLHRLSFYGNIESLHVWKGKSLEILEIEKSVVINFKDHILEDHYEFFNPSNELFNSIMNLVESSTTIEKVNLEGLALSRVHFKRNGSA